MTIHAFLSERLKMFLTSENAEKDFGKRHKACNF